MMIKQLTYTKKTRSWVTDTDESYYQSKGQGRLSFGDARIQRRDCGNSRTYYRCRANDTVNSFDTLEEAILWCEQKA